jgi:hypothetical protein
MKKLPTIDMVNTGKRIEKLRRARGFTVSELQECMGFNTPQSIYKWQKGKVVPTIDHLVALSSLFDVTIDEIIILTGSSMK